MSKERHSTILILPRGIGDDGEISDHSKIRADAALAFWYENKDIVGRFIAGGLYSSSMKTAPANNGSEGRGIHKRLLDGNVPEWMIREELKSQTTAQGIIEAAKMAREGEWYIDEENPLFVVCSWDQFHRARPLASQAFGVRRNVIQKIKSPEPSGLVTVAFELGAAALTELSLVDAKPGVLEHTARAERRVEAVTGWIRGLPGFTGN